MYNPRTKDGRKTGVDFLKFIVEKVYACFISAVYKL